MVGIKGGHLKGDLAQAEEPAQGPPSDTDIAAVTEIAIIPFWANISKYTNTKYIVQMAQKSYCLKISTHFFGTPCMCTC